MRGAQNGVISCIQWSVFAGSALLVIPKTFNLQVQPHSITNTPHIQLRLNNRETNPIAESTAVPCTTRKSGNEPFPTGHCFLYSVTHMAWDGNGSM